MDNQHKKITGYRDLTQDEIDAMNFVKDQGAKLEVLIAKLKANDELDQRWVSIAETHLQQGVMAAVRSIAKPQSF